MDLNLFKLPKLFKKYYSPRIEIVGKTGFV